MGLGVVGALVQSGVLGWREVMGGLSLSLRGLGGVGHGDGEGEGLWGGEGGEKMGGKGGKGGVSGMKGFTAGGLQMHGREGWVCIGVYLGCMGVLAGIVG